MIIHDPRLENSNSVTKPLYLLVKLEVDPLIVRNQSMAEAYADQHCEKLEYALCDWYYPDDPQYPYIAK